MSSWFIVALLPSFVVFFRPLPPWKTLVAWTSEGYISFPECAAVYESVLAHPVSALLRDLFLCDMSRCLSTLQAIGMSLFRVDFGVECLQFVCLVSKLWHMLSFMVLLVILSDATDDKSSDEGSQVFFLDCVSFVIQLIDCSISPSHSLISPLVGLVCTIHLPFQHDQHHDTGHLVW